ncbi:MAG: TrkA family potassium uptake protein [Actinomycetota bacterium]|nr:TrkA family potassium uptake protein [Actinomycetota bacterium]MDQ3681119.1 TrkA family potassium uptake protein [Actinomycetota bacterium]
MHAIVVGCGRVGAELAMGLELAGHSVAVIDKDAKAFFRYLPKKWSGKAVHGFGFDKDHLEEAGAREAGALAATTGGDNSNILTARIARETYRIARVVARIQDPRRAVIYERLGIPTVAQVSWAKEQVMRRLFSDETVHTWTDVSGQLSLVEKALPDAWAGRRLAALGEQGRFRVTAVTRNGEARMAGPDLLGQEGDILHVMVAKEHLETLEARLVEGDGG